MVQQSQARVKPTIQAGGVAINDGKSLAREADSMGARALQVSQPDHVTSRHAAQASKAVKRKGATREISENTSWLYRDSGGRGSLNVLSKVSAHPVQGSLIQRQILKQWGFDKYYDLAKIRARGDETSGYTPPQVNSVKYDSAMNSSWVSSALKLPTINAEQNGEGEYVARVEAVPTNHAGYMMHLPMPGPWSTQASKAFVFGYYGIPPMEGAGNVTLEVTGTTSASELEKQVERHETVHAKDITRVIEEVLNPWDKRLTYAEEAGTPYRSDSAEKATTKLWTAMYGTPQAIGARLDARWSQDSDAFYKTAKGSSPPPEPQKIEEDYVRLHVRLPI